MPEPQPESDRPATESPPAVPSPRDAEAGRTAGGEPTRTDPQDEPTRRDPGDDQAIKAADPPRWTGSAPVPPAPVKRRWGQSEEPTPPPQPPLSAPETAVPVDPWADADDDPWHTPADPFPPLPPTRPYPELPPTRRYPAPPAASPISPPPAPPRVSPVPSPPALPPAPRALPAGGPGPSVPPAPQPGEIHKNRRREQAPAPQPVPPGWQPPKGYVAVPVRRRRRWPARMLLLTALSIACCCGCPAYYAKPVWDQYPAKAALPAQVADLSLRDDQDSKQITQRLTTEMRTSRLIAEDVFAGVYATPADKVVILFGTTGFRLTPEQDVADEIDRLTPTYQLTGVESIETGVRGEYQRCGTGSADGTPVVVCAWADHGSLATAVFTQLSVEDSAALLTEFRAQVITRG